MMLNMNIMPADDMNIKLKECTEKDFEKYYEIRCEKSDIYWMGFQGKPDIDAMQKIYYRRIGNIDLRIDGEKKIFFICLAEIGAPIGFIQLTRVGDAIEFGYSIIGQYQGQGYGTEAMKEAILIAQNYVNTVFTEIRDDNIGSQKICLKNGFIRTDEYVINEYPDAGKVKFRKYIKHIY